jgi:N-acyl homoserine lactone hydrolase
MPERAHRLRMSSRNGSAVDVDQTDVTAGLAVGSQENIIMATEAMMKSVGYEARRVIPVREERLKDRFPAPITADGLRISEISLADGEQSRVR